MLNTMISFSRSVEDLFISNKEILPEEMRVHFEKSFKIINDNVLNDNVKILIEEFDNVNYQIKGLGKVTLCQALCHLQTKTSHSYKKYIIEGKEYTHCKVCGKQKIKQRSRV